MKKILLACLFMFSCTLIPASANTDNEQKKSNEIEYSEDGTPIMNLSKMEPSYNIDLSGGLIAEPSITPFAYGDLIYNYYYLEVPARKSIDLGLIHFAYAGDRVRIEWDGATNLNPQMDFVAVYSDGSQYSLYESKGFLMDSNAGAILIEGTGNGYVHIWMRSLNYSNVTFYRVTLTDGAR